MYTKPRILICFSIAVLLQGLYTQTTFGQNDNSEWSNTQFEIKEIEAVRGVVMRADVPVSELGSKMGEMYGKLFAFIESNNLEISGPAFAVYYSFDPEGNSEFETGIPVTAKAKSEGNIEYKEFESVNALSTIYTGSYENLMGVYTAIFQYMEKEKLESTGVSWEVYLTDPMETKDPNENKTQIYFPLK